MRPAPFYPPMLFDALERRVEALEGRERDHAAEHARTQADRLHQEIERGRQASSPPPASIQPLSEPAQASADLDRRMAALEARARADAESEERRAFEVELLHDLLHRVEAMETRWRDAPEPASRTELQSGLDALRERADGLEARLLDDERRQLEAELQALSRRTAALEARERNHAAELRDLESERRELEDALAHLHAVLLKRRSRAADAVAAAIPAEGPA